MKLERLLQNISTHKINAPLDSEISELTLNSNDIKKGSLFFAIRGGNFDGNNYINDAIASGASCVVTESEPNESVPYVLVEDAREAMAKISGNFYENCHKHMKMIAITGTNGKTTTAHMIANILKHSGKKVTVAGTLGTYINGEKTDTELTTPDPIEFHKLIAKSYKEGVTHFIYEASAHAIYLKKLSGIIADIAVFTNFSQDHLDFFKTLDSYRAVKRSFFTKEFARFAVINADDNLGINILKTAEIPITSYGIQNPSDVFAIETEYNNGFSCVVNAYDDIFDLKSHFHGEFNIYNSLGAITVARLLSIPVPTIKSAYEVMQPVSGRFNLLRFQKRSVVIDFAHTPEGLKNLLISARLLCKGKLISVFGCGGNRDSKKRPLMGAVSAKYSDFTILTSDNSRHENPNDIIRQIEEGHKEINNKYIKITEREKAIAYALITSKQDDLVVIAGKGGEEYSEENGIKTPYSDTKVVEEIIKRYEL
ncbi:MAG: UDP-N-acetylmuramoyl-L-alanyl-D-glutamate--2,6-diaminopimelate ligase [Firmicutes bacterium]|nr:UDP-N-acetylmuramoyl-L-alanyl-D-glutamate--2,6-diaminopimelate ligase [Bacillota bacterium]